MEQRTDDWFSARLGKVTASRVADVMARTKTGYGASRANYMAELLCQRLTGRREEGYTNAAMQRGTELEPVARMAYTMITGNDVVECGFVENEFMQLGASPDGLVGDDGLIEIKCPNTATMIDFIRTSTIDNKYILQMQTQMLCTGRKWCDFVMYDDRLPEQIAFKMIRVDRDNELIGQITHEVGKFLSELDAMQSELLDVIASVNFVNQVRANG